MLRQPQITAPRPAPRDVSNEPVRGGSANPEVRLSYCPGLDGLRALAVSAVLLYHADLPFIPGGFLGVEVFFVISGYLISALLLAEWRQKGRINLKDFWLRRARRLLPALYVLLVVTLTFAVVFLPEEVAGLRADVVAALGYVTNWFLIFGEESYFESVGRASLLQHLWSLAVEEQFYLIWPVVLAVGLGLGMKHRRQRWVLTVALVGAAGSAVAMRLLFTPGVDPSRIYYGTDTRATGLLCGAALAFLWSPGDKSCPADKWALLRSLGPSRLRRRWWPAVPLLLDIRGRRRARRPGPSRPQPGRVRSLPLQGRFRAGDARHGRRDSGRRPPAVMGGLARPRLCPDALGGGPLLRHLPLALAGLHAHPPRLDVPFGGVPLLALRIGLTIVVADLSYRVVERPIRRGALGRAWRAMREARGRERRRLRLQWAGAVLPAVAFCTALGVAAALAEPPKPPSYLSTKHVHIESAGRGGGQGDRDAGAGTRRSVARKGEGLAGGWGPRPGAGSRPSATR